VENSDTEIYRVILFQEEDYFFDNKSQERGPPDGYRIDYV
jgi:hypothetical protein